MKYEVGDRVQIKGLDWYNENKKKELRGCIDCGNMMFTPQMSKWCGEVVTIVHIENDCYMDKNAWYWTDEMIEGLMEEEVGLVDNLSSRWVNEFNLPEGYIFKDENGNVINATKIVLEKKKKEYPKTYEECAEVLCECAIMTHGYKRDLLNALQKLLICRDAYWKIAGDWRPEFRFGKKKYCIMTKDNEVISATVEETNRILVFPTAEMRDAFYENFKELIEQCKELL